MPASRHRAAGADAVDQGQLIALAAAVGFAVAVTMVKSLTRTESGGDHLLDAGDPVADRAAAGACGVARPSTVTWGWVVVVAFCGTYSHYCLTRAMRHADATTVVPMDFLRVPLTGLAGWLVYAERIDGYTVTGAALILAGNLLNLKGAGGRKP